jgi:Rrf2 family protein
MLTMKTRYALKALGVLSERGPGQATLIAEIAEREGIPRKFLEAILRELRQQGLLLAQRGRGGGYRLRRPPEQIALAEVVRALDGPLAPVPCLTSGAHERCPECRDEKTCGVRLILKELHEATAQVLENTTLADLVRTTRRAAEQTAALRYAI